MTTPSATDEPAIQLSDRARLEILGAILLALFLFALDQTVVGTALPGHRHRPQRATSCTPGSVTIYLLTATISGPIYGKLSDLFGRRPIIIFAVSLFLIASVVCRPQPGDVAVHPVPRAPGPRWRRRLPGRARGGRRPLHAGRAGQVPRPVRGGVRAVVARRAGHRRHHHRQLRLALDLLRQRADRPHLAVHPVAAAAGHQAARCGRSTSTTSALRVFTLAIAPFLIGLTNKAGRRMDRSERSAA